MTLHEFNILPKEQLSTELTKCCGSSTWVKKMLAIFPVEDFVELLNDAEEKWYECGENDWKEAFDHHPKIGDMNALKKKFAATAQWASGEQSSVSRASEQTIKALAEGNGLYEEKFGYIFIICATGRSAEQMLRILRSRLSNKPEDEIKIAMEEQNKITKLRLEKLLA